LPFTADALSTTATGGTPYGASHVAGPKGHDRLSDEEQELALLLGRRVADVAVALRRGRR